MLTSRGVGISVTHNPKAELPAAVLDCSVNNSQLPSLCAGCLHQLNCEKAPYCDFRLQRWTLSTRVRLPLVSSLLARLIQQHQAFSPNALFIADSLSHSRMDRPMWCYHSSTIFIIFTIRHPVTATALKELISTDSAALLTYDVRIHTKSYTLKTKPHSPNPRTNYTDRATAACRQSNCQLLRIEGATWSAWRIPTAVFSVF
jgi:hypothetical protein